MKAWLEGEMQREKKTLAQHRSFSVLQTLVNWRVLALAAIHFGQAGVSVGLAVFVAQIIKGLGLTNMQTGFTTVIPYAAGTIGMLIWGHYSDGSDPALLGRGCHGLRSCHRPMRPQERADVAHRERDLILGVLPRVEAHLRVRREMHGFIGGHYLKSLAARPPKISALIVAIGSKVPPARGTI